MIRVAVDDIAFVVADAVLRPATSMLEPTTAALRRLEQVGGPSFWKQLRVQQELAVGAAVVTAGGELPSPLVIHAIIMSPGEPVSSTGVRRALTSALQRASAWEIAHLAVPVVGTGAGGLAVSEAVDILVQVLAAHLASTDFPRDVLIVVEREDERQMVDGVIKRYKPDA